MTTGSEPPQLIALLLRPGHAPPPELAPPGALAANFQAGHASSILVTRSSLRAVKQGLRLPPRPQRQIHTAAALVHLDGQHLV
jgi:hypothetical protein